MLLAVCPATIFPEVIHQLRHRYRRIFAAEELTALQDGEQLQPLVAAARHVRAVASSLTRLYDFILMIN
jgi:hypothetical protein